jgi:adenylosuccinate synthase
VKHPIVLGLQYGDEGKGKITDYLARQAQHVIRFNGGSNAGHTLWLNGKKLVTHSVPSGILYSHVRNFIGSGCVIDPLSLQRELGEIASSGSALNGDRLKIDYRAHITLPIHLSLDGGRESVGVQSIGTTRKGIGPTYTTKMDRCGIRVEDLYKKDLSQRVEYLCKTYNHLLEAAELPASSFEENMERAHMAAELLRSHVSYEPVPFFEISKNEKCVLEGAQGVLLDLDHGSYPYVTSSNTLASHSAVGTPFPMSRLGSVVGVAKFYQTRVGSGPFPTELKNEDGERIRVNGGEFGATTGRPRRVGWLNLDELRLSVRLSDCTHIVMTKADVLCGEEEVKVFANGALKSFKGWKNIFSNSQKDVLGPEIAAYVKFVEEYVGVPITAIGTGADRSELFWPRGQVDFWSI